MFKPRFLISTFFRSFIFVQLKVFLRFDKELVLLMTVIVGRRDRTQETSIFIEKNIRKGDFKVFWRRRGEIIRERGTINKYN